VFGLDLVALLDEWREASNAIILVRTSRKKRVWEALAPFTDAHMPDDVGGEIARLIDVKALWVAAGRHDPVLSALGTVWRGLVTNVVEVEALFAWAEATRAAAERLALPDQSKSLWIDALVTLVRERRSELSGSGTIRVAVTQLLQAYKSFDPARMEVARLADTDEWLGLPPEEGWLVAAATMVQGWERSANQLQRWCKWQEVTQTAQALGLAPIVSALASGMISADEIASTFELGYARCWIEQIVEREEALCSFVADQHNDTIACFAERASPDRHRRDPRRGRPGERPSRA
jgi:hypothetical protein